MLHWLTGGALQFTSCGNPYDIVRFPGFEFGIEHPQSAFRKALERAFPRNKRRSRPGSNNWIRRAGMRGDILSRAEALSSNHCDPLSDRCCLCTQARGIHSVRHSRHAKPQGFTQPQQAH
jgi:hypothetical protein